MFYLHWKLALVILLPMPFIAAGGWIYARWVSPRAREAREAASGLNSLLHDNIAGIRQIKSYTLEEREAAGLRRRAAAQYRERQTKLQRAWAVYGPGMGLLGDTGVILLMGFGAWWAIQGEITIGQLGQFLLLIGMLYEPIGTAARRQSNLRHRRGERAADLRHPRTRRRGGSETRRQARRCARRDPLRERQLPLR